MDKDNALETHPASEDQTTCDDCAGPVISWRAPDALWNRVMGGPDAKDDPGGIICHNCFIQRAELAGVAPAAWLVDAPQPTPVAPAPVSIGDAAKRMCLATGLDWDDLPETAAHDGTEDREWFRMLARAVLSAKPGEQG